MRALDLSIEQFPEPVRADGASSDLAAEKYPTADPVGDLPDHADSSELRSAPRLTSLYRACFIISKNRIAFGIVRNVSAGGAEIQTNLILRPGDRISYRWDGIAPIESEVVWRSNGRVGVKHRESFDNFATIQPDRSVRVPCNMAAEVWIAGQAWSCLIANISLKGMLVCGLDELPAGTLVSICSGAFPCQGASIRWSEFGFCGVSFADPLSAKQLSEIIDSAPGAFEASALIN